VSTTGPAGVVVVVAIVGTGATVDLGASAFLAELEQPASPTTVPRATTIT